MSLPVVTYSQTSHCYPPTTSITILSHFLLVARHYPLLHSMPVSMPPFLAPFTSPWRWMQQGPLKHWYPTAILYVIITQKTSTWIFSSYSYYLSGIPCCPLVTWYSRSSGSSIFGSFSGGPVFWALQVLSITFIWSHWCLSSNL
jgi:hypothetical protein